MTQATFLNMDNKKVTVKIGDFIGFKCDIEQSAEVIEITERGTNDVTLTVKAPSEGFAGEYIGRNQFTEIQGLDTWTI